MTHTNPEINTIRKIRENATTVEETAAASTFMDIGSSDSIFSRPTKIVFHQLLFNLQ